MTILKNKEDRLGLRDPVRTTGQRVGKRESEEKNKTYNSRRFLISLFRAQTSGTALSVLVLLVYLTKAELEVIFLFPR